MNHTISHINFISPALVSFFCSPPAFQFADRYPSFRSSPPSPSIPSLLLTPTSTRMASPRPHHYDPMEIINDIKFSSTCCCCGYTTSKCVSIFSSPETVMTEASEEIIRCGFVECRHVRCTYCIYPQIQFRKTKCLDCGMINSTYANWCVREVCGKKLGQEDQVVWVS